MHVCLFDSQIHRGASSWLYRTVQEPSSVSDLQSLLIYSNRQSHVLFWFTHISFWLSPIPFRTSIMNQPFPCIHSLQDSRIIKSFLIYMVIISKCQWWKKNHPYSIQQTCRARSNTTLTSAPAPYTNWLWQVQVQHEPDGTVTISIVWVRLGKPDRTPHGQRMPATQMQRGLGRVGHCSTQLALRPAVWRLEESWIKRKKNEQSQSLPSPLPCLILFARALYSQHMSTPYPILGDL